MREQEEVEERESKRGLPAKRGGGRRGGEEGDGRKKKIDEADTQ